MGFPHRVSFPAAALLLCVGALAGFAPGAFAQDEEQKVLEVGRWYNSIETGLNLTQSAYSDNWNGGDKGSLVWAFIANASFEKQINAGTNWKNTLRLAYGQTHQQSISEEGKRTWDRPDKSTDQLEAESVFRFTRGWAVDPYVSGRFESQFQDVSDPYGRMLYINPIVLKESGGVAHQFYRTEEKELLSRFGFTFRQSYRKSFIDSEMNDETRAEWSRDGGLEWVTDYKTKVLENKVSWTSRLAVYQPLYYSFHNDLDKVSEENLEENDISTDVVDYPLVVDVDWENIFTSQITSYLAVNLYVRWLYDKYDNSVTPVVDDDGVLGNPDEVRAAVRKAGQFKQTLSLSLTYRFL